MARRGAAHYVGPVTALHAPTDLERARVVCRSFEPCEGEVDVELDLVEGAAPAGLRGVLYRNGVHSLEVQGVPQMHPFDGEGMVSRFAFEGGRVRYRNRVVRTREVLAERRAGRMLYRAFGTNRPGGLLANALRMRFKNAANTSVVHHAGRLLALWEAGLPHALDPETLETIGRFDFDGALQPSGPLERLFAAEMPFSAHPAIDPEDGSLHNFGVLVGAPTKLVVYRVDRTGALVERTAVPLPRASFVHDFVLTPSWRVFFLTPVRFDVPRALSGLATPVESLSQAPGAPTEVLLVPREGPDKVGRAVRLPAAPSFTFHWINGFEDDAGRVIVDGCRMDAFPGGTVDMQDPRGLAAARLPPPRPTRWTLDVSAGRVEERALSDVALELPTVHPADRQRRHRFAFGMVNPQPAGPTIYSAIGKLDCESGEAQVRDFGLDLAGECVLVPRSEAPDDVWLLVVMYVADAHRSDLVCLDGRDLSVQARWRLPHHHPPGFHGCFVG